MSKDSAARDCSKTLVFPGALPKIAQILQFQKAQKIA